MAEPPRRVVLWFDEELDARASTVTVHDLESRPVDLGDGRVDLDDPDHASMVVSLPELAEGVYVVRWRVVTIDDDGVTEGEFDFVVGDAAPRPQAAPVDASPVAFLAAGVLAAVVIIGIGLIWRAARP